MPVTRRQRPARLPPHRSAASHLSVAHSIPAPVPLPEGAHRVPVSGRRGVGSAADGAVTRHRIRLDPFRVRFLYDSALDEISEAAGDGDHEVVDQGLAFFVGRSAQPALGVLDRVPDLFMRDSRSSATGLRLSYSLLSQRLATRRVRLSQRSRRCRVGLAALGCLGGEESAEGFGCFLAGIEDGLPDCRVLRRDGGDEGFQVVGFVEEGQGADSG